MKKYLLGLVAIMMAIGMSAYTAPKRNIIKGKKTKSWDLYWFKVKPGYGIGSGFSNAQVDFITVSPYVPEYICNVFPWTWKCTIGFEVFDVDPATNKLYPGTHYPAAIGELRPDY
jgi:hypothetical protein